MYQAMRVTGAADPTVPVAETIPGKLPQRKLVTTAAAGYSSYGNQIGLATGQVHELYHPGYAAKRMEIGAVMVPRRPTTCVARRPAPGEVVVLWRPHAGTAAAALRALPRPIPWSRWKAAGRGAEGQRARASKIQRLFRRGDACRMIKRCNDFGAGGVSVAIGNWLTALT